MNITPEQALSNLQKVAEAYNCDGPTRDILRECVKVLAGAIAKKPDKSE